MRDFTYPSIIVAAKTAFRVMNLDIHVQGAENVPRTGGAVLALNHISYVDFIFGGLATQPTRRLVRFMAKRELFDHRLTGPLMRSLHHIEVDREDGVGSYQTALDYLASGEIVGLFPEATISRSFELKDFKSGVVRMAEKADVPLIPLVLWGTQRIYTKDHPKDFSRGKAISLSVGPAVPTTGDANADTALLRSRMAELLDETIRAYPQHEEGAWWLPKAYGGTAPSPQEAAVIERAESRARAEKRRAERQAAKQPPPVA